MYRDLFGCHVFTCWNLLFQFQLFQSLCSTVHLLLKLEWGIDCILSSFCYYGQLLVLVCVIRVKWQVKWGEKVSIVVYSRGGTRRRRRKVGWSCDKEVMWGVGAVDQHRNAKKYTYRPVITSLFPYSFIFACECFYWLISCMWKYSQQISCECEVFMLFKWQEIFTCHNGN